MRSWLTVIITAVIFSSLIFWWVHTYYEPVRVIGMSMNPTLQEGEWILVKRTRPKTEFSRNDLVVFWHDHDLAIKRLIGLPDETLEFAQKKIKLFTDQNPEGELLNEPDYDTSTWSFFPRTINLDQHQYFVLGDRRAQSLDSRDYGPITRDNLLGTAIVVYWPPFHIRWLRGM